ncbi:MAG: hypothetical protein AB1629_06005 [Candidatus Omnitrophota bacterium]
MEISNKSKIFITVSFFLIIGLVLAIFLSFQVMQDTKPSIKPEEILPPNKEEPVKQPSIYDVEIPFSSTGTLPESVVSKPEENKIDKKRPTGTLSNVKTFEQEQAELSAGLQDKYDSSPTQPSPSDLPTATEASDTQESVSTEIKVNQPNEEQIRDLQKKGIIIF